MSAARELANFLTGVTPPDLPAQAMDHAAVLIASTLASAAMGSTLESSRIVKDMAVSLGGSARASIWFDKAGPKLPVVYAAQVNAVMSDAAASDDSDLRTIVHCGTPLVATALAAAEHHGGTGEEVLAAIVVGYEASGRIIDAMTGFRERGFHGSQAAIFSATVAAARLLHLDAEQTTHAIALTATSSSGLAKAADTSVAREYHAGMATMAGIQAVRAAQRGYKAEERILEMKLGFFEAVGGVDGNEGGGAGHPGPRRLVGHRHRHGGQAGARRPPIPCPGRGRRQRCARGAGGGGSDRKHHRVEARPDRAQRTVASQGPGRHGA